MTLSFARRLVSLAALALSLGCASTLVAQTTVTFASEDADGSTLSFNRTVTAGGTADFTFSAESFLAYEVMTGEAAYPGIYALSPRNDTSGTALLVTASAGYVFDFNNFNYATDVAPNDADNKIYLDVTYGAGGTGSISFDADDSNDPAFLGGLATFANDITSITISTNGFTVIHDITVSDIHVVPEPATYTAGLGAMALIAATAWRRRRAN